LRRASLLPVGYPRGLVAVVVAVRSRLVAFVAYKTPGVRPAVRAPVVEWKVFVT
jgi:hypothetical protein